MSEPGKEVLRSFAPAEEEIPKAAARFASTAEAMGLVDAAYAIVDSPLGDLFVASSSRGLIRLAYGDDRSFAPVLEEIGRRLTPRILEVPSRLDDVRRQLDEYFAGVRRDFELPLDLTLAAGFRRRVLEAARLIPYGETASYGRVAQAAGSARAVRAGGTALALNPIPIVVPCHRVLRSTGELGGYTGGLERKRTLLRLEGALP